MPDKRRLVTSNICFGSKISGLWNHSYNNYALFFVDFKIYLFCQYYFYYIHGEQRDFYPVKNSLYHTTSKIKIFIWGLTMILALY